MDTIMTLVPIVVAILSGLWVAYHRKHKTPWVKTWLKVIAVLIGLPVCAYMGAKGLGLTDANVKWLIGPLTLMLFSGIASVVGIFGYSIIGIVKTNKKTVIKNSQSNYSGNSEYHNDYYNSWGIIYAADYAVANDEQREAYNRANIQMWDEYDDDNY